MTRWTVMLIPHNRGRTRNLEVAAYQLGLVVILLVALSFSTAFLFKRHQVISIEINRLRQVAQELRLEQVNALSPTEEGLSDEQRAEIEERIRAEYEAGVAAITAELSELYEIEAEARTLTGFAPRTPANSRTAAAMGGGKGGAPTGLDEVPYADRDEMARPPHLIYGLSRPSADLIIQEINLRTASLQELTGDIRAEHNRMDRLPSVWPTVSKDFRISSRFGYRKDPFESRVRHHDGTDICAPYGSPIQAVAKGKVMVAGREAYLGNVVKIDHGNGMETWYAHLKECLVKEGDEVEKCDVIGTLGSTGRATGPHLHYEVHINGKVVDSGKYLPLRD